MNLSIERILELEIMEEAKLVAGSNGLSNPVNNVSVLELPVFEETESLGNKNEFYITGLFAYKDHPERLIEMFRQLWEEGCSGICSIDVYFRDFPKEVIEFCNTKNLPLILISQKISYASILSTIFQLIIRERDEKYLEGQLEGILLKSLTEDEVRITAKLINQVFNEQHIVIYFSDNLEAKNKSTDSIRKLFSIPNEWLFSKFRKGYLIIVTLNKREPLEVRKITHLLIDSIKHIYSKYTIGISEFNSDLGKLDASIREALIAHGASDYLNKDILNYGELGVYKLLFQLKSDLRLRQFRDEIIEPIKEYDKENHLNLFDTAILFIENDGDLRKTAEELFVHINTVRYRIDKIKRILNLENSSWAFNEQLSLAIKADKILNCF